MLDAGPNLCPLRRYGIPASSRMPRAKASSRASLHLSIVSSSRSAAILPLILPSEIRRQAKSVFRYLSKASRNVHFDVSRLRIPLGSRGYPFRASGTAHSTGLSPAGVHTLKNPEDADCHRISIARSFWPASLEQPIHPCAVPARILRGPKDSGCGSNLHGPP